jgi:hypothetical protein
MNANQHMDLQEHVLLAGFLAPKGSTDWCPSCGWDNRCAHCRAWQD